MLIGARTIKTGIAVTATLFICNFFHIEPASFAVITAVVNMQPSFSKSLNNAWQQIGVHILAASLALLVGLYIGANPISIGATVISLILICNWVGWSSGITFGIVSIIFILDSPPDTFLIHALSRTLSIFVGLGVALIINRVLAPPRYKTKLIDSLQSLLVLTSKYFLESLYTFIHAASLTTYQLPHDTKDLKDKLDDVMLLYENAREEITVEDNPPLIERLLEICRGFIERGQSINQMTFQRVKRRQEAYSPLELEGISEQFQGIIDILSVGHGKLNELILTLRLGLIEKKSCGTFEEDISYWESFDKVIDEWNRQVSGVFYLRALMEVSVVATELRWAVRRTNTMLNLIDKHSKSKPFKTKWWNAFKL